MRDLANVSSDESTILILIHNFAQLFQWFHDELRFFFHCLLLLENILGWALSPFPYSLLSIWNGPLIQVLIKDQMQFVCLRTCVLLYSVVQVKYFLQFGSIFCRNAQKKRKTAKLEILNADRQFLKYVICIFLMLLCVI